LILFLGAPFLSLKFGVLVKEENTYLAAAKNPDNRRELQITSGEERVIEEVEKSQLTRTLML
jgi:hypothetical protein